MVDYQNGKRGRQARTANGGGGGGGGADGGADGGGGYGGQRRRTMAHTDIHIWGLLVANDRSWWVVARGAWGGWWAPWWWSRWGSVGGVVGVGGGSWGLEARMCGGELGVVENMGNRGNRAKWESGREYMVDFR